jgi:Right handed beta helix region
MKERNIMIGHQAHPWKIKTKKTYRKLLPYWLCLLLIFLAACSQTVPSDLTQELDELGVITKIYYVAPDGNDSNDGSAARPWRTISYAVSAASPVQGSEQIKVRAGLYQEEVELGKSGTAGKFIRLVAEPNVTLRYKGGGGGFAQGILESSGKSYWVIRGFRIEGLAPNVPETTAPPIWGGIVLKDATSILVRNNSVYRTGSSGIIVLPASYYGGGELEVTSKNIRVTNNTIDNANNWLDQEALSIWGVNGFDVSYNLVKNSKTEGIDAKVGSRNGRIHHNTVTNVAVWSGTGRNGGPAIYIDGNRADMYNIDVYNNVLYNNRADAIAVADEDSAIGGVRDIRIYNNIAYNNGTLGSNGGQCLSFGGRVTNVQAYHNTCYRNIYSFTIDAAYGANPSNITLRNNIFADPTYQNAYIKSATGIRLENNLITTTVANLFDPFFPAPTFTSVGNIRASSAGFVNAAANDFHLTASSAARDKGSSTVGKATTDFDGVTRPQGASPDMGAFEYR